MTPTLTVASPSKQAPRHWLLTTLLLGAAYVVCGKLGLLLAIPPGYASAIFPPAGIAVAAAFMIGRRAIPGVLLGSFILNLWIAYDSSHQLSLLGGCAALLIAVASLLQALLGGALLRRVVGYPAAFDNLRDVLSFQLLSPLICLTSATLSVSSLQLLGLVVPGGFALSWFMWWVGDTLGLLVLVPLTMVVAGAPRPLWRKRFGTVAVPMLFAFTLLVILYVNVSHWEQAESLVEFRLQSQRLADTMQARLDEQESLLEQTKGLFAGDDRVTAEEFHQFTRQALKRFPMIQAIEWAPRVEGGRRAQFEAEQRPRVPGFQVRERDAANVLQPAARRAAHYPVTFVEPLAGNQPALGFDIVSTPNRAAAVAKAISSGRSVATPPLHLVQAPSHPFGFLLLQAVSTEHTGNGIVLTAIRVDDFLAKLLPHDKAQLCIRLTDSGTGQVVHNNFVSPDKIVWQQQLAFGQRVLLLETSPSPAYLAQHRGWQSPLVLAAGILGTGLLGAFLMLGTGYTARVEAQVEEKIAELSESSEKLTGLYQLSPLGIALTDMGGRFIDFNEAFLRICGYPEAELRALDYWTLTPRRYEADEAAQLASLQRSGRYGPYEKEYLRKDGSLVQISLNGLLLNGRNGEKYIWSIVEDITERKQAEATLRDSEERWKFALEGAGDGVWDWNLQTGELYLTKREMEVLGFEGEEAQWTHIDHWADRQHLQDKVVRKLAFDNYLAGKAPVYSYEFRTRTRDGRWKWVLARGILVSHSADGRPLRMIGTHTDIDERKRQQAQDARRSAVMEMLARGGKLHDVLETLIASLEVENDELTFMVFSQEAGEQPGGQGRHLPMNWFDNPGLDKVRGGSALLRGTPHEQPITSSSYLRSLQAQAQSMRLELCWSEPIVSGDATLEGVLVSFRNPAENHALPDLLQQQQAANLLSIAIQHERVEQQLQLANSVYVTSSEAIVVTSEDNLILAVNPAFETITGYSAFEVVGSNASILRAGQESSDFLQALWASLRETGAWRGEFGIRRRDGATLAVALSVNSILDEGGKVTRRVAVFSDITARKEAEQQINHLAHHDLLTNLPNRALFADRLSQALALARRNGGHFALLYIDLDNFKPVNDNHGHGVGDRLLQAVAGRMLECVRETDTIARIGGDEFVAILSGVQGVDDAGHVAEKIRLALGQPFEIGSHVLDISSSIGGAVYPEQGTDESQLMQHADIAMYQAKNEGRNTIRFYRGPAAG
ncbi:PAS domain S-box protein [Vogesella sp. LIG4]|uniref:PAS domain S-box protein n=1 Tax=Vogesella sp. LIG4 TaxID=1192162 RepID=UPI00081FCAE8|nr:PAS domain S-box protein [Vogesella sp. LIG4]SCK18490.1 PAS domain S-box-containing protein/diguanylate cyclase (GGDEF) domain-containing protein [Vogesella sp. LIG4]